MSSGKWYWEVVDSSGSGASAAQFGIVQSITANDYISGQALSVAYNLSNGSVTKNTAAFATVAASNQGVVIGFEFDADALTLAIYKGSTLLTTVTGITAGTYFAAACDATSIGGAYLLDANFGQRPWSRTPNSGYKALCTANLPTPTGAAAEPKKHFDVVTRVGAGPAGGTFSTSIDLTQGGLLWDKPRNAAGTNHHLIDSVRGISVELRSNATDAEASSANYITTFNNGSFSTGSADFTSSTTLVDWLWKAGGAPVTNNAGTITSQVSANTLAGFSIVTYTGNNASGNSVGHGLGVAPKMIMVKARGPATRWIVWFTGMTGTNVLCLNTTAATATTLDGYITNVGASTFQLSGTNTNNDVNAAATYVAYCFAEVPGLSKFGSYTGNGAADGPFVYCGFKPKWVMIKRVDVAANWRILDSTRDINNAVQYELYPNLANAEGTFTALDFISSGFKLRNTDTSYNAAGGTYIFVAFAEAPFQYANAR